MLSLRAAHLENPAACCDLIYVDLILDVGGRVNLFEKVVHIFLVFTGTCHTRVLISQASRR